MLKKEITYEDFFTEEDVTETFYFNLTQTELTRFEAKYGGDLEEHMTKLQRERKTNEMMAVFEDLILGAYGVRDGNEFEKSEELSRKFMTSAAYDALFTEIGSDLDALGEFFRGIIPRKLRANFDEAQKVVTKRMDEALKEEPPEPPAPPVLKSPEPPTQ